VPRGLNDEPCRPVGRHARDGSDRRIAQRFREQYVLRSVGAL